MLEGGELYRKEAKNQDTWDKYGHGTPETGSSVTSIPASIKAAGADVDRQHPAVRTDRADGLGSADAVDYRSPPQA